MVSISVISGQEPDYPVIFGSDWQKAISFLEENDSWIRPALIKHKIPYNEAIAIIFPELVRYSALRDKMETSVLKALYCSLGDEYADFSIGVFQIKPSFAERIISEAGFKGKAPACIKRKEQGTYLFRKAIVDQLEDPKSELNYLIAFYKICRKRFPGMPEDEAMRIRFLATAYNTGFWKTEDEIIAMQSRKFFNTKIFRTENYSYADVSLCWLEKYSGKDYNNRNK